MWLKKRDHITLQPQTFSGFIKLLGSNLNPNLKMNEFLTGCMFLLSNESWQLMNSLNQKVWVLQEDAPDITACLNVKGAEAIHEIM